MGNANWDGVVIDPNNLKFMNDVLRNIGTTIESSTVESGFIDVRNAHNLYMRSNSGAYSTIGPRGERNIIKNVPTYN